MPKKFCAAIGSILIAAGGLAVRASAGAPCVGYSVSAPVAGTRQGTACSPVPLPSQFDTAIIPYVCTTVTPARTTACGNATVYTVTP